MDFQTQTFFSDEFRDKLTAFPGRRQAEILLRAQLRYFLYYWAPRKTVLPDYDPQGNAWAWLNYARALLTYDLASRTGHYNFNMFESVRGRYPSEEEAPDYAASLYAAERFLSSVSYFMKGDDAGQQGSLRRTLERMSHEVSGRNFFLEIVLDAADAEGWDFEGKPLLNQPEELDEHGREALAHVRNGAMPDAFVFWRAWFEGVLRGHRIDVELQRRVVEDISEADWDRGLQHVASIIADIKSELEDETQPAREKVLHQAKSVLTDPFTAIVVARGLDELIQMAMGAYTREVSNALPEELKPLEQLSVVMNQIAVALDGSTALSDREEKLARLLVQMAHALDALNSRLLAAKQKIRAQDGSTIRREAFHRGAGNFVWSPAFWGSLGATAMYFLGPGAADAVSSISSAVSEGFSGDAASDTLPTVTRHKP